MKDSFLQGNGSLPFTLLFYIHTNQLIMFIQPSNLQSSAIRNIRLNPATSQVIVQFLTSAKTYLYDGVCNNAMANFIFGELTPGEFVNTFKGDIKPLVVG